MTRASHVPSRGALVAAAVLALASSGAPHTARAQDTTAARRGQAPLAPGLWRGARRGGGLVERLAMRVDTDAAGTSHVSIVTVDIAGPPVAANFLTKGDSATILATRGPWRFVGVRSANGDTLTGRAGQFGKEVPASFVHAAPGDTLLALPRPQDPVGALPYRTRELLVEVAPQVRLAGTLVVPEGRGPFPAALLVGCGCSATDRDGAVDGHRPFLVLADRLARAGIASFRYDPRGTGRSTGSLTRAWVTTADFAADAGAVVRALRTMAPEVAPDRIGIVGQNIEGGEIAPMVAAADPQVRWVVLLGATGLRGDSATLLSQRRRLEAQDTPPARVDSILAAMAMTWHAVGAGGDSARVAERLDSAETVRLAMMPPADRATAADIMQRGRPMLVGPWTRWYYAHDPAAVLRTVHVPLLAVGGALDLVAPQDENLAAIAAAAAAGGNREVEVAEFVGVNHFLQHGPPGGHANPALIEETMAPEVLDRVTTWVGRHAR